MGNKLNLVVPLRGRWVQLVGGAVLTLLSLAWALRGMSPVAVWNTIKTAHVGWLALGVATLLASCSVRAVRWGTLLHANRQTSPFAIRHSAVFIGFAGNCLLPASAGEVVRAGVLQRFAGVPLGVALGSILAERLLDFLMVFAFLLVALAAESNVVTQEAADKLHVGTMVTVLLVGAAVLFFAAVRAELVVRLVVGASRRIGLARIAPKIEAATNSLLSGLNVLRSPRRAARALLETLCIWCLISFTYWSGMLAFGITSPGWTGAMFVQSLGTLSITIPSSPGYFGPFEAALRFSLDMFSIPTDTTIAYTLSMHFLLIFSLTSVGLVQALRLGLSWANLVRKPTEKQTATVGLS